MKNLKMMKFFVLMVILPIGYSIAAGAEPKKVKAVAISDREEKKNVAEGKARKTCSWRLQRECGKAVQNIHFFETDYKEYFIKGKRLYKATVKCNADCNK